MLESRSTLSDAQRRFLCRIVFVVACLLPTWIVAQWAVFPTSRSEWRIRASHVLGWPVNLDSVQTPTPQQVVFRHFRLNDTAHGAWLDLHDVTWSRTKTGQIISLRDVDLTLTQFSEWVQHACVQLPKLDADLGPIDVTVSHLTIRSDLASALPTQTYVAERCQVRIEPAAQRMAVEIFPSAQVGTPIRWEWLGGSGNKNAKWSLHTYQQLVPCWLLAGLVPQAEHFGDQSHFVGYAAGEFRGSFSSIELSEFQLVDVDPARWIHNAGEDATAEPPVRLNDEARFVLDVRTARIENGRFEALYLVLHCDAGVRIAGQWLNTATKWLRVELPEQSPSSLVSLQGLAFAVELRDGALALYGQKPDDLIARDESGQAFVFATSGSKKLAPYCLAGWIADRGESELPITEASLRVLTHLPLLR